MKDEDNVCEACLPKAVALKFRCYPYHAGVKVFKVSNCQCAICGNSPAKALGIFQQLRKPPSTGSQSGSMLADSARIRF